MCAAQTGTVFLSPFAWNYYPSSLPSSGHALNLRLSHSLSLVENAADFERRYANN